MKITYDNEAEASYIYFTLIERGEAVETIVDLRLDVELDKDEKITSMRIFENENCVFQNRLKYVFHHPEISYDEKNRSILLAFTAKSEPAKILSWHANIDLDQEGQILGVEVLFAHPEYRPNDGCDRLYADGKLDYLSKYIVSSDVSH